MKCLLRAIQRSCQFALVPAIRLTRVPKQVNNEPRIWLQPLLCTAFVAALALSCSLVAGVAYADNGPLTDVSPGAFQAGLAQIITAVGMPIGGTIIFLAVCIAAIQIATSKFNPDRRENVYHNLLHVCVGAGILGAALFIASVAFNIGANYFKP